MPVSLWGAVPAEGDVIQLTPIEKKIEADVIRERSVWELKEIEGAKLFIMTFVSKWDIERKYRSTSTTYKKWRKSDALKSAFVHHVSYELRSPLTTIIGFAQLLDDPVIGPLNAKQREYVGHITESSAALLAIINDILDLATIDAGAMQLEISDVNVH